MPPHIYAVNIQPSRSFCYIGDLVAGIMAVHDKDVVGEVINLGNPQEFTLNEAITELEKVTGQKLNVEQKTALPDDPKRRNPDISKAKRLLGWEPQINFAEGIKLMLESYHEF